MPLLRAHEYAILRAQWTTVTPAQLAHNKWLRERLDRVNKDILRTDRDLPFYEAEDNANTKMLSDILCTYCMYNFDLGWSLLLWMIWMREIVRPGEKEGERERARVCERD